MSMDFLLLLATAQGYLSRLMLKHGIQVMIEMAFQYIIGALTFMVLLTVTSKNRDKSTNLSGG